MKDKCQKPKCFGRLEDISEDHPDHTKGKEKILQCVRCSRVYKKLPDGKTIML